MFPSRDNGTGSESHPYLGYDAAARRGPTLAFNVYENGSVPLTTQLTKFPGGCAATKKWRSEIAIHVLYGDVL